jgi:predicted dehydrogenase
VKRARPVGVGVIGLGYIGRTHVEAYRSAARAGFACRIAAACDRRPDRLAEAGASRSYRDAADLLADPEVDLVSICTPTDSHADLAIAALRAGKHVLVEKPLALRARDVERVAAAARRARTLCMPAHCMRFWPGWSWLRERIADGRYGRVRSAVFARLSSPPAWSSFYRDTARSGGALADLHVHDADFVRWCFGEPDAVDCAGSIDHVTTLYRYARGPAHVVAEGGWDHAPGFPFEMRYVVAFERATADFDASRSRPLRLSRGGTRLPVRLPRGTGYDGEVRHLLAAIRDGRRELAVTVDDAAAVARLLERERAALAPRTPTTERRP